jgi:(heptosyl)LPS beta-1,4-glucosyltransferase
MTYPFTVCIFARNEAARIADVINDFRGASEIIIFDNGSTDETARISESLGVSVIHLVNPGFIETPLVMDEVERCCKNDYLLVASCSEFVPKSLLRHYSQIVESDSADVVYSHRRSLTDGKEVPFDMPLHSQNPKYAQLRFFRKGCVSYEGNQIHGKGLPLVPPSRIMCLPRSRATCFLHFRSSKVSITEQKHASYNQIQAVQEFGNGKRISIVSLLLHLVLLIAKIWWIYGARKFGKLGLLLLCERINLQVGLSARILEQELYPTGCRPEWRDVYSGEKLKVEG